MTKNTAYYKAAFAKSEAASPYAKMNPHMKGHGMHNPSMKMNHGSAMEMNHGSAMEKHDPTHMKMGHKKTGMKMAGKSHMKGTLEQHREHHKAEHQNKEKKSDGAKFLEGLNHPRIPRK